jgi:hypothetical protein
MIGITTETCFEVSKPVIVGSRTVFVVSSKLCLFSKSYRGIVATLVSPIYVIVIEQKRSYALSMETGKSVDLDELFQENPTIRSEFWKIPAISIGRENILTSENRLPDLYSPSAICENGSEDQMSTLGTEKETKHEHEHGHEGSHEHRLEMEDVRKQITSFGNQIHEYFDHVQAEVENYKFTVEKHGDGIEVEVQFKAYVHPKTGESAKVVPK